MGKKLLTSTEAARVLGASATSIKRWADEGVLPCVRTVGNHRRFEPHELERFARERMGAGSGEEEPRDDAEETGAWLADLLDSGPYRLQARLYEARAELGTWRAVCDRIGPVIGALGEGWANGEISVVQEHLASERLTRALTRVGETIPVADNAPRALLATLEGEEHTLGLSLAELALRELGWMPLWAGRKTPIADIETAIAQQDIHLLAVSASVHSSDPEMMQRQADMLSNICRPRGVVLLFGGRGAWPVAPSYGALLRDFRSIHQVVPRPDALSR